MAKRMTAFAAIGFTGAALLTATLPAGAASEQVDLELVLAVDVSRSMDPEEFAVQRAGYVAALRHRDFIDAVQAGLNGRIALTYFEWAADVRGRSQVDWRVISDAASANAFADELERHPVDTFRGTSVSAALRFAARRFDANAFQAWRKIIDISGDGPNNIGLPVADARDAAVSAGIVINGLPILIRPSVGDVDLDRYYADCVTGGAGSFVLPVREAAEFATAIRRKLILEVSGLEPSPAIVPAAATPVDCLVGEKLRRMYSDPYFPELDRER